MKVTYEWDNRCQYGGPIWVKVIVDGIPVSTITWVNGPPDFLYADTLVPQDHDDDEQ